jgi:hypothetical protein
MTSLELTEHLSRLGLNQTEVAQLLGISARTVRRWVEGEEIPGPAEAALRAWRRLSERNLPWRPDSVSIVEDDQEQISKHRQLALDLDGLLRRVEARGGPSIPWTVNMHESRATLGSVEVSFYKLQNGGFSLSYYTRRDMPPDAQRDQQLIEDAAFCIAKEFEKNGKRAAALNAVADDVKSRSTEFGSYGPNVLDRDTKQIQQQRIEALADQIADLAAKAAQGLPTTPQQFYAVQSEISGLGFATNRELVSAVARTYIERTERVRVLLVKSGDHGNAVTQTIESDADVVNKMVFRRKLKYLGNRLPPLNESARMRDFAGPEHVVLDVPRGVDITGAEKPGLYLVHNLHPSKVLLAN